MSEPVSDGVAEVAKAEPKKWEPLPEKVNVLVVVFTYAKQIGADVFAWCTGPAAKMRDHPRVGNLAFSYTVGYPTDRCRNAALVEAKRAGFHYAVFCDDDMAPDCTLGQEPGAKPFFPTALEFALAHDGPCLVGAPYCSAPPSQDVLIMKDRVVIPDLPDGLGRKIDKYSRDEAAVMTGIQRAAALPTGLMLVDVRVTDILEPPYFEYEYADKPNCTRLASTEDVVFSRNLSWLGCPNFAAWDCWAGHVKTFTTGKPRLSPIDEIPRAIRAAWDKGWRPKE